MKVNNFFSALGPILLLVHSAYCSDSKFQVNCSLGLFRGRLFNGSVFVPTVENGEELCIRMYFSFFLFVFDAKSGTTQIIIRLG